VGWSTRHLTGEPVPDEEREMDSFHGTGMVLPNKPWKSEPVDRSSRVELLRAGELCSVAAAVLALFLVGYEVGSDRSIDAGSLSIGVAGALAAFTLSSVIGQRAGSTSTQSRLTLPYSEQRLLQIWPARPNANGGAPASGFDSSVPDG
jgi:hypothetical protein